MRTCNLCDLEKDDGDFIYGSRKCRDCRNNYLREYYSRNKEVYSLKGKEYLKNLDDEKRRNRNIKSNDWAKRNRDKRRVTEKNRYKENKLLINARSRMYKALVGLTKSDTTKALLGAPISVVRSHLEEKFSNGMSWDNYGEWHVDHIKPCASFDLSIPEQQLACFHYTNLQPLWAKENMRKGATLDQSA